MTSLIRPLALVTSTAPLWRLAPPLSDLWPPRAEQSKIFSTRPRPAAYVHFFKKPRPRAGRHIGHLMIPPSHRANYSTYTYILQVSRIYPLCSLDPFLFTTSGPTLLQSIPKPIYIHATLTTPGTTNTQYNWKPHPGQPPR